MDIAIPYSGVSSWQQNELRFALRSIEKNCPSTGEIFIIGKLPAWSKNLRHIPFSDGVTRPNKNIFDKMVSCPSEQFIAWFDDHYLLKPVDQFPPHYNGIIGEIKLKKQGRYFLTLQATENKLKELELPLRCYDSHIPCVFEKEKLLSLKSLDWNRDFALKSIYFNMFGPVGNFHESVKTSLPFTKQELIDKNFKWLSSSDNVTRGVSDLLHELFPDKSYFEK